MPAVICGKTGGTRQLLVGRKSYATRYTLTSAQYGSVTCQMRVVCTYHRGFKGKHGIQYTVNLWVYLLWFFVSRTQRGGRVVYPDESGLEVYLNVDT